MYSARLSLYTVIFLRLIKLYTFRINGKTINYIEIQEEKLNLFKIPLD